MAALFKRMNYGFCAGLALSAPFVAEFISWKYAGLLFLPWAAFTVYLRPRPRLNLVLLLFFVLFAAHGIALVLTDTPFTRAVIRDLAITAPLLAIALFSRDIDARSVAKGFFSVVVAVGVASATLGLVKHGLQDRGYLLHFIIEQCPGRYPQGSNLCTDYNILGMQWLVALAGIYAWRCKTQSVFQIVLLCVLIAAGLTVGSRRFILLLPIILVGWTWMTWRLFDRAVFRREIMVTAVVALGAWGIVSLVTSPETFEKYRFSPEKFTILFDPSDRDQKTTERNYSSPNRAYLKVIAKTIVDDGAGSRLDRWRLGAETFLDSLPVGQGFNYHQVFTDRFVNGKFLDHPHLPLLSEGIIGGLLLFFVAGAIYALLFFIAIMSPPEVLASGAPLAFIAASGVAAISGDTMFSIFQWTAVAMLLIVTALSAKPTGTRYVR